jgi:membrane-bound metal-dependent hydrolase YbcI (DUF457 family)
MISISSRCLLLMLSVPNRNTPRWSVVHQHRTATHSFSPSPRTAVPSLFFEILVVVLFAVSKKSRRHPSTLFLFRVSCSMLIDIISITNWPLPNNDFSCGVIGVFKQFAVLAADLWFVSIGRLEALGVSQ